MPRLFNSEATARRVVYPISGWTVKVLDIVERERKPDLHLDRKADDFRTAVEILEGIAFCHGQTLRDRHAHLNWIPSDTAPVPIR